MARPSKYDPQKHPDSFVELSKKGFTKAEICTEWEISRDTLYRWKGEKSEFSDAIKKGEIALEAWFTARFKEIGLGKSPARGLGALIWLSKNCLRWSDNEKEELENGGIQFVYIPEDERELIEKL